MKTVRSTTMTLAFVGAVAVAVSVTAVHAQRGDYERIRCESKNHGDQFCRAEIAGDVRLVKHLSDTACREGRNWRWDRSGIWVTGGCRAEFEYRRRSGGWGGGGGNWGGSGGGSGSGWGGSGGGWGGSGGGWGGSGGGWGAGRARVTCQSEGGREQFCPAPIGGDVAVARQMSDAPCVFRRSWNWTEQGVTVWDGCRAEFAYSRRDGNEGTGPWRRVTCQSQGGREQVCPAPIGGSVRVARNISDTRCVEGRNWEWTRDGVRVWGGCRADFEYRSR